MHIYGHDGDAGDRREQQLLEPGQHLSAVVADLNPVLRGWAAYFRNGNSGRKFNTVDGYVHERLAIFASRKHRLRGRNWTTRFTYEWITRLGVHRLTGNVRWATAHASR
ncbi:group II intron maturase-specific domain-containing protein [Streptomyces sp. A30]|uniref:group II intron maturase-specific domain-containing protein n=1 Tax=Streptomyces sp. A30 TaxID=2789273 RepID=UPI00397F77A7